MFLIGKQENSHKVEIRVHSVPTTLNLPAVVVEPDLVALHDVEDDDLTGHAGPVPPVGDGSDRFPVAMELNVERFIPAGQGVHTEEIHPGHRDHEDPVLRPEVRPEVSQGLGEADVSEVVGDWVLQEHVESHELSHVAGAGEESLEARVTRELLHVAVHDARNVVFAFYHPIPRHQVPSEPDILTTIQQSRISSSLVQKTA